MGGAETIDLEWVQVHPTGLVKPDDPDAKVKFLAAEALRGVGGLVFDANGKRFANELGRRDYVTGEMWKNKPPFRLVLNKAASDCPACTSQERPLAVCTGTTVWAAIRSSIVLFSAASRVAIALSTCSAPMANLSSTPSRPPTRQCRT